MQLKQDMPRPGEYDNVSKNFGLYEDNKLEEQDIKGDYKKLIGKSSDIRSRIRNGLSRYTL